MLVILWWLAKSGCQYQLSSGFASWVTLDSREIFGRQGVPAAGCSESPECKYLLHQLCDLIWKLAGPSQMMAPCCCLSVRVRVRPGQWRPVESVTVSVSGQEAARRGGGTVHSTPVQCCSTELSTWAKSGQRSSLKLSCDRNINTEAPLLPLIHSQEVRCRDGKMLCGVWKSDLCFLCIARPYPEKYLPSFLMHNPTPVKESNCKSLWLKYAFDKVGDRPIHWLL